MSSSASSRPTILVVQLLLLAALLLPLGAAAQPAAVELAMAGRLVRLEREALAGLPMAEQAVEFESSHGSFQGRFGGTPLVEAIRAAGLLEGMSGRDRLRQVVRVIGRDGHVATFALAEIDPAFAGRPVLLAWRLNGEALPELRLAVPGDRRGGRNVRDVVRVALE